MDVRISHTGISDLEQHLSDWRLSNYHKLNPHELSLRILHHLEHILKADTARAVPKALWHEVLHITGQSDFLQSLNDPGLCIRWAEAAFQIIRISDYSLCDLFDQRMLQAPRPLSGMRQSCGHRVQSTFLSARGS